MKRKLSAFMASMCGISITVILLHLGVGLWYIIAIATLSLFIYSLSLYERDLFHKERYEKLQKYTLIICDMLLDSRKQVEDLKSKT